MADSSGGAAKKSRDKEEVVRLAPLTCVFLVVVHSHNAGDKQAFLFLSVA